LPAFDIKYTETDAAAHTSQLICMEEVHQMKTEVLFHYHEIDI
jgi:hypothetical protein